MKRPVRTLLKIIKRSFTKPTTEAPFSKGGSSVVNDLGKGKLGEKPISNPVKFEYEEFDHLEIVSGNPKQSAFFYCSLFGFEVQECEDVYTKSGNISYFLKNGGVRLLISGSIEAQNSEINDFLAKHGDAVRQVGLRVKDLKPVENHLQNRGISVKTQGNDSVSFIPLYVFENVKHVLVERKAKKECSTPFWPGLSTSSSAIASLNKANSFFNKFNCNIPEFLRIDHVGFPQARNCSEKVIQSYYEDLGFYMFWSIDEEAISSKQSSLKSTVVSDFDNRIRFPIFEPVEKEKKSQIQEFLDYNGGAGAQHIAIEIKNILKTVKAMRERGVEFLSVSDSYYQIVREKLQEYHIEIEEDLDEIQQNHILLDFDIHGNYLLQIFTKPLVDRPTMFLEFIQRNGHQGFGEGNFNRLFLSIEKEQQKRGNLV